MMKADHYIWVDDLKIMTPEELFDIVQHTHEVGVLRDIAKIRFPNEAVLKNNNPREPFIEWPAINRVPRQHWLPLLLAKVAKAELLANYYDKLVVIAAPSSATWYIPIILENGVFEQAIFPRVLKEHQLTEHRLYPEAAFQLPVSSYVHNRHSKKGDPHGTQTWYFSEPGVYERSTILILDDALAEGVTGLTVADALTKYLGAARVFYATPMAKIVQGGLNRLQQSPNISGMSVLIHVTDTNGSGGSIEFY